MGIFTNFSDFLEERRKKKIETTIQLKEIVEKALVYLPKKEKEEAVKKSCVKVKAQ